MNTTYTETMIYYLIKFVLEAYTIQEGTKCDGKMSTSGELVFKVKYFSCMQEKSEWFWEKKYQQQAIVVPSLTIVHPCLDVMVMKYVNYIPRGVGNKNQAR